MARKTNKTQKQLAQLSVIIVTCATLYSSPKATAQQDANPLQPATTSASSTPTEAKNSTPSAELAQLAIEIKPKLKIDNIKAASGIKRIAITSCNVLFGIETSASAKSQAGFGEPTRGRTQANVSSSYSLVGIDANSMQEITKNVCADAAKSLSDAGFEVVPQAECDANANFQSLQKSGKATPYEWSRNGSTYKVYTPTNMKMTGLTYISTLDLFGSIGKALSIENSPMKFTGDMMKALNVSAADINILVDFAKQESSNVKGFFNKIAGNSNAEVKTDTQMSVSGFMTVYPMAQLKCYDGYCMAAASTDIPKFSLKEPLLSKRNVVMELKNLKTTGDKVGEVAANVLGVAMALSGYSGSTTSIEKWGVSVDAAIYEAAIREIASGLVTAAALSMQGK